MGLQPSRRCYERWSRECRFGPLPTNIRTLGQRGPLDAPPPIGSEYTWSKSRFSHAPFLAYKTTHKRSDEKLCQVLQGQRRLLGTTCFVSYRDYGEAFRTSHRLRTTPKGDVPVRR
eukprot:scaffold113_cov339-Pavlova_lutheri.AAC.13